MERKIKKSIDKLEPTLKALAESDREKKGFSMKNKIIFDIDGTLADISHRKHYLEEDNVDWESFFKDCPDDKPKRSVIMISRWLYEIAACDILLWTGRNEIVREETQDWLDQWGVEYDELRMRPKENHKPDYYLKEDWLEDYGPEKIICAFDDRDPVIEVFEDHGITCFKVV